MTATSVSIAADVSIATDVSIAGNDALTGAGMATTSNALLAAGTTTTGDAIVLAIYVAFLLYLAARLLHRTPGGAAGYLLAGRSLTLPVFVGTLVASWYGGILGVGEYGYRYGISNWLVFGVPYYIAAALFAVFIAGRARRSPYVSIPDALRRTYGEPAARLAGVIVFIVTAPAAYVLMLGTLFAFVLGLPPWMGIVLGTALSLAHAVRGGLRTLALTDMFQFVLMFGGFAVAVAFLVLTRGTDPILHGVPSTHWTWHGGNSPQYVIVWFFIALATLVEPMFYQNVFAARSPAVARRGILISIGFWILFDALTTTTALYARALLPSDTDPVLAFPALAANVFPAWLAAVFFIGMLATIISTVDTNLFIASSTLSNLVSRDRDELSERAAARARWGILGTAVWVIGLAVISESVVDLWHDLGSIGTPALLLPMIGTLYPALRIRRSWIGAWIVIPASASGLWLFAGQARGYWFGVEPIYVGLLASAAIRLLGRGERSDPDAARRRAHS